MINVIKETNMKELVTHLLEKEILTEEYAQQLQESLDSELAAVRAEVVEEQTVLLAEEWKKERQKIVEALDAEVNSVLEKELEKLKEDIQSYRDLEVEYEMRLLEETKKMKETLDADLNKLAELTESFIQLQMEAEITDLKESIEEARRNQTGQRIFEAYLAEFEAHYAIEGGVSGKASQLEKELKKTSAELEQLKESIAIRDKQEKIEKLIEPLSEAQKPVMASILNRVPMEEVDNTFKRSLEVLIRRDVSDGKDSKKSLTEGLNATEDKGGKKSFGDLIKAQLKEGKLTLRTGDQTLLNESEQSKDSSAPKPDFADLLELAGIPVER